MTRAYTFVPMLRTMKSRRLQTKCRFPVLWRETCMASSLLTEPPIRQRPGSCFGNALAVVVSIRCDMYIPSKCSNNDDVNDNQVDDKDLGLSMILSEKMPSRLGFRATRPEQVATMGPHTTRRVMARNHHAMLPLFIWCPRPSPVKTNRARSTLAALL